MAKAMDILDVIKVLLGGGYICEKCPSAYGKIEYSVHILSLDNQPNKYAGHISNKQFTDLCKKGIITYSGEWGVDKYSNFYNYFHLASECYIKADALPDVFFSKSSLMADLNWLESVGCKSMEIKALRERLEYGAVKPASDIARATHGKNDNDGGMNCVKG